MLTLLQGGGVTCTPTTVAQLVILIHVLCGVCDGVTVMLTLLQSGGVTCWLLNVPATCVCISGTDLHRQLYVLPH